MGEERRQVPFLYRADETVDGDYTMVSFATGVSGVMLVMPYDEIPHPFVTVLGRW